MPQNTKTLEETLTDRGVEGWFLWRPNQVYVRDPQDSSNYLPTDVVADRSIGDIIDAINDEGDRQIQDIQSAGETAVDEITQHTDVYARTKQVCVNALSALKNYFELEDIPVAVSILDNALDKLNAIP